MTKIFSILLGPLISLIVQADSPLRAPEAYRVCNKPVTVCAYLEPYKDTVVYRIEGDRKLEEMYRVSGWHRSFYLSPNGEYSVVGYSGLNLVPKTVSLQQVMLSIYLNGKLSHLVTLSQLFNDLNSLQETVSHYHWGSISHVSDNEVRLQTVEGVVLVNLKSGKILRGSKS